MRFRDEFGDYYETNFGGNKVVEEDDGLFPSPTVETVDWLVRVCLIVGAFFILLVVILFVFSTKAMSILLVTSINNGRKNLAIIRDLCLGRDVPFELVRNAFWSKGETLSHEEYVESLQEFEAKYSELREAHEIASGLLLPGDALQDLDEYRQDPVPPTALPGRGPPLNMYVIGVKELVDEEVGAEGAPFFAGQPVYRSTLIVAGEEVTSDEEMFSDGAGTGNGASAAARVTVY